MKTRLDDLTDIVAACPKQVMVHDLLLEVLLVLLDEELLYDRVYQMLDFEPIEID